jgi:hypothetical protein
MGLKVSGVGYFVIPDWIGNPVFNIFPVRPELVEGSLILKLMVQHTQRARELTMNWEIKSLIIILCMKIKEKTCFTSQQKTFYTLPIKLN